MTLTDEDLRKLRTRVRFKVCYDVGFYCPDVDDIVQETLTRYLVADRHSKINNPEAAGAYINGICRNVVSEYRRKNMRTDPMPDAIPEPPPKKLPEYEIYELQQAIAHGLAQLAERDRKILRAFYLEETSKDEILRETGLSDDNFRVVLCRAKERFRAIYLEHAKQRGALGH